jgi:hypothetical protein
MFSYTDGSGYLGPPVVPTTHLNHLERHIKAWNTLDWVESHVDAPPLHHDLHVLCQGIFAMFDHKRVYCIQLPHLTRGILCQEWTLKDFSFSVDQIEIDPSNNLLVVVSR